MLSLVLNFVSLLAAVGSSIGGALVGTEWGMVLLGIFLGAGSALMVAYMYYLMSQYRNRGVFALVHMSAAYSCCSACVAVWDFLQIACAACCQYEVALKST